MTENTKGATESELTILKSIWQEGPGTVREIHQRIREHGRTWAYTTLQTLLARLESKELVAVDRSGFAHVFDAIVTREEFLGRKLTQLADDVCDGASTPLVMALVDGAKFSAKEIAEFRKLLDDLDSPKKTTKRKRGKA